MTRAEKEKAPLRQPSGPRGSFATKKSVDTAAAFRSKDEATVSTRMSGVADLRAEASVEVILKPTPKLTAAMSGPNVGPFRTKKELFDALEAKDEG